MPGKDVGKKIKPGEKEDPLNLVHVAQIKKGDIVESYVQELEKSAFGSEPFEEKKAVDAEGELPAVKVHPALEAMIKAGYGNDSIELMINFADDVQIPRFPSLVTGEERESRTNKRATNRAAKMVREIEQLRASSYEAVSSELSDRYGAKVTETFWLINAVVAEMTVESGIALTQREDVRYVEPRFAGEVPPQNAINTDDVDDGRARMVSDPYFNLGQTTGFIGLLDTGVRATHVLFNNPSNLDFRRDCVNGGANCNTGNNLNPNDDCWNHGTASAAIISGNNRLGNAFRGVTGITLDSFKVYPSTRDANGTCSGFLDRAAAVRGFQAAVAVLDRVIVAEMQGGGTDASSISAAADNAFDAGAVIIAANGNNGPGASTVNEPAIAHKVLGVGNFDVQNQTQVASQSRGPAPDNRFKPDIQAPTNAETASNASDTALRNFGGTSGATPFAAGAAALLRNWLRGSSFSIDPGQVYAQMILAGQQTFPFNNTSGAGPLVLPTNGWAWWGKVQIIDILFIDITTINIPLDLSGERLNTFDAALWWPETQAQQHNDIDLRLIDPSGTTRAMSLSIPSVFERARVSGRIAAGRWTLQIRGFRVPTGIQSVYWAAHVQTS